ncbi:putative ubiquinone biosynthesis protein Coq4 [Helianthus annuus]|nr:putative ubiquinone biosynthesis protein Coq4 [Helianthus annuus]
MKTRIVIFVKQRFLMVISCVCDCRFLMLFQKGPESDLVVGNRRGSAVGALVDPRRVDLIAGLGETTGKPTFERVLERMKRNPKGREVLLDRPRVNSNNVGHAWDLPENTFGVAYAKFMGSRNFSPDDRPPV